MIPHSLEYDRERMDSMPFDAAYAFAHATDDDAPRAAVTVIRSRRFDRAWTSLPNGRKRAIVVNDE